jgi:hypothetical protein
LIVNSSMGIGTANPNYQLDVAGDIQFSGDLYLNGTAVYLPDSSGNGGTTLMLQAQDNGQPMYLHVTSSGTESWTTSP